MPTPTSQEFERYDEPPLGVESADPDSTVPGWRRG